MNRLIDWEARLNALLEERMTTPHQYGVHDCALFGGDIILALSGEDPAAPFRGGYSDAEGAARALREIGAGTITKTFDLFLDRVPVALARRGDLAMYGNNIGCVIGGDALFIGEAGGAPGLIRVPMSQWARAWVI